MFVFRIASPKQELQSAIEPCKMTKRQGTLGNVGIMSFAFSNFQADNYGTSSGDDEGNCVYN